MATNGGGDDIRTSILRAVALNLIGAAALRLVSLAITGIQHRVSSGPHDEKPFLDPLTGDHLTRGEHAAWMAQRVIRRWSFLALVTLVTLACWALGTRIPGVLLWWNLAASFAAVVIEGITAMALINQTLRDALVSRQNRTMAEQNVRMERDHGEQLSALNAKVDQLLATMPAQAAVVRDAKGRYMRLPAE